MAYRKTGLHGIPFISTIDLLQPPRATVHPPSPSSSLHGFLFIQPPSRATPSLLFNHPSTVYCSSSPPLATVQLALHRLLFIRPSMGSCSSSPSWGPVHPPARSIGVLFIQRQRPLLPRGPVHPTPTGNCSSKPPSNAHCSLREGSSSVRSASVSSSSEGLDRSLGFS